MEKLVGAEYRQYWEERAERQGPGYVGRHGQTHKMDLVEQQAQRFWEALRLVLPEPDKLPVCEQDTIPHVPVVIEFGAGWGRITHRLAERYQKARVYGIEIVPDSVARGSKLYPNVHFVHGEDLYADQSPYRVPMADLLVTCTALQHVTDPNVWFRVVNSFHAKVVPGGYLVLLECNAGVHKVPHMADRTHEDYKRELYGFRFMTTTRYWKGSLDKEEMVLMAAKRKPR